MPIPMYPPRHSMIARAPVPTIKSAFISDSDSDHSVPRRCCARQVSVCSSTALRTNSSSSRARANSLTVRMLV